MRDVMVMKLRRGRRADNTAEARQSLGLLVCGERFEFCADPSQKRDPGRGHGFDP
jgi:hypothetical protein